MRACAQKQRKTHLLLLCACSAMQDTPAYAAYMRVIPCAISECAVCAVRKCKTSHNAIMRCETFANKKLGVRK